MARNIKTKTRIRTMESDIASIVQSNRPTLSEIISNAVESEAAQSAAESKKRSGKLVIILLAFIMLALAGGGWIYYTYYLNPSPKNNYPNRPNFNQINPPFFFATETSRTISLNPENRDLFLLLITEKAARRQERLDTMKQIIIQIVEQDKPERFLRFEDLPRLMRINPPQNLPPLITTPVMMFIHYTALGERFGMVMRVRNKEKALANMLLWEDIAKDLQPFFFDEEIPKTTGVFQDEIYRNIDFRYLPLSPSKDIGIAYGVFPAQNYLIITTSKGAFKATVDRLFNAIL